MAKRAGLRGLQADKKRKDVFAAKGDEMAELQIAQLSEQMAVFKSKLEIFAEKYKKSIKKNPEFRTDFQKMCAQIGVDPLASNKGFWSELLGMGDFYYELGVGITEVCIATRGTNGGLIEMKELRRRVMARRGKNLQEVSEDDIERSVKKLQALNPSFAIVSIGKLSYLQSVPLELNKDVTTALELSSAKGFLTLTDFMEKAKWDKERCQRALNQLVGEGIAWVDDQAGEREYWVPTLIPNLAR